MTIFSLTHIIFLLVTILVITISIVITRKLKPKNTKHNIYNNNNIMFIWNIL